MVHRATLLFMRIVLAILVASAFAQAQTDTYELNDSHFHLTNYIQEGTPIRDFLGIMGTRVGRVALSGIPLQQQWSNRVSGDNAPTYYLNTDAPLYYYSFTDAFIAMSYLSLTPDQRARFDPMITGFNPSDMYAADHIRRVLKTFPGVFSGIGEFTVHKEFVSSKISGEVASLQDPALDRVLSFAGEGGLVALIHNDMDQPFAKDGVEPVFLRQMKALLGRHPDTTIIWAHTGLGRVIHPVHDHVGILEGILKDPAFSNVYFDISWDEVAKFLVATPETSAAMAGLINRYPTRFLFGTDEVAPKDQKAYLKVFEQYRPMWALLSTEASEDVRKKNYERIFDAARVKVRACEKAH